jgi:hypothetical protein
MNGRAAVSILSFLAGLGVCASAGAQPTQAQQDAIRSNCRSDFLSLCSGVPRGGREAFECLAKNQPRLSAGCRAAVGAATAAAPAPAVKPEPTPTAAAPAAVRPAESPAAAPAPAPAAAAPAESAPKAPSAKTPATRKTPAPKAVAAPARPAPAAASPAAPPAAAPHQPRLGEAAIIRRFCFTDFRVLCKGVPLGQGRAIKCLADNRSGLSPDCKQAMADTGN